MTIRDWLASWGYTDVSAQEKMRKYSMFNECELDDCPPPDVVLIVPRERDLFRK